MKCARLELNIKWCGDRVAGADGGALADMDRLGDGRHFACPITGAHSNCLVRSIRPTSGHKAPLP